MDKNYKGILVADRLPTQYIVGDGNIVIPQREVMDWTSYLPIPETQKNVYFDTTACLTESAIHCIESQINFDIVNGRYSPAQMQYFTTAGYMQNGKFKASVRYSAITNGTTTNGNYIAVVADAFRTYGLLPDSDMPFDPTMTSDQYFTNVTPQQIAKGKAILQYINIQYREVTNPSQIPLVLPVAPVQIITPICPGWDSGEIVGFCSGSPDHATVVYGIDSNSNYKNLDSYPPFEQTLASNYELIYIMQFIAQPVIMPTQVVITRNSDDGIETLGTLVATRQDGQTFTCKTLERPWLNNQTNISCIPPGTYPAIYTFQGDLNEWHYELQNVLLRVGVFQHEGNFVTNSEGCILLGAADAILSGTEMDITSSKQTVTAYENFCNKQPIIITIIGVQS